MKEIGEYWKDGFNAFARVRVVSGKGLIALWHCAEKHEVTLTDSIPGSYKGLIAPAIMAGLVVERDGDTATVQIRGEFVGG